MEQLKAIKQQLVNAVAGQLGDLSSVHTKELGEVVDMIKDLEEAMYYCSIVDAMEKSDEEQKYYTRPMMYDGVKGYVPYMEYAPYMMRDSQWRESHMPDRSSQSRRMYMEGKQYHGDQEQSIKELEHYMKDLGEDLTDMVKESSAEERQILSSRLQQLANKIIK